MSSNVNQQLLAEILVDLTKVKKSIDELLPSIYESSGSLIKASEEAKNTIDEFCTIQNDLIKRQLLEKEDNFHELKGLVENRFIEKLNNEMNSIHSSINKKINGNNRINLVTLIMVVVISILSGLVGGLIAFQYHDYKQEAHAEWGLAVEKSWKTLDKRSQKIIRDNF